MLGNQIATVLVIVPKMFLNRAKDIHSEYILARNYVCKYTVFKYLKIKYPVLILIFLFHMWNYRVFYLISFISLILH